MTAIAAVTDGTTTVIGCDSAGTDPRGGQIIVREPKLIETRDLLVGYSGSFRMGQLLAHAWIPPKIPRKTSDVLPYLVADVVTSIRETLRAYKHLGTDDDGDRAYSMLLACRGRLFEVTPDFGLLEPICGYAAVGAGADYALGSLYSTEDAEPFSRVTLALEASAAHNASVAAPFHLLTA